MYLKTLWKKECLHVGLTAAAAGGRRMSRLRIKFRKICERSLLG